jgi:predicted NBD/HSP70 family sugar kinase
VEEVVPREKGVLDGIGFGVPGQVIPADGSVHSPDALGVGQQFRNEISQRLGDKPDVVSALGGEWSWNDDERRDFVARRIYVDNDARSATRAVLSRKPEWRDFACIFAGSGLGGGFVLQGAVYYGPAFSAGEVGHMTVHLSPGQHGRAEPAGLGHAAPRCGCDKEGVHWEALVSGPALEELADQRGHERAGALAAAFGAPTRTGSVPVPALAIVGGLVDEPKFRHGPDDDALDAVQKSIKAAYLRAEQEHPHRAAAVIDAVKAKLREDPGMGNYVREVLSEHARYFAVGVATLLNVANISHLALGGGVMDALWPLEFYKRRFYEALREHALDRPLAAFADPELNAGLRPGWAWRGSALLFRDPSYEAAREGRPFVPVPPAAA